MQVFISATSSDLAEYRQLLSDYVRKLGCEVSVQEECPSDYRPIQQLLVSKIKPVDMLICLVGSVYGEQPKDQPFTPPRSYTQLEYFIGKECGKPVFVFFPKAGVVAPGAKAESDDKASLQRDYISLLMQSNEMWHEFDSLAQLQAKVAETVQHVSGTLATHEIVRKIESTFPTPLARLVHDCLNKNKESLAWLASETLRFLALLATHDALSSGVFAKGRADNIAEGTLLESGLDNEASRQLLRLATPPTETKRFIPRLAGWEYEHESLLDELLESLNAKQGSRPRGSREAQRNAIVKLQETVLAILRQMDFLERYVLSVVTSVKLNERTIDLKLFRGRNAEALAVTLHNDTPIPTSGSMFLLDLDHRRALPLTPVFSYQPTASQEDVWGLLQVRPPSELQDGEMEVAAFAEFDPITITIKPSARTEPGVEPRDASGDWSQWPEYWRCGVIWGQRDGETSSESSLDDASRFLDEPSWKALYAKVFPHGAASDAMGGSFTPLGEAFYPGRNTDIYEALPSAHSAFASDNPSQRYAVHLLRGDCCNEGVVRNWFEQRADNWKRLDHPRVLSIDGRAQAERPYIATRYLGPKTLAENLLSGREPATRDLIHVLRVAAEVCKTAHREGLRVLAYPLRHFLLDESDGLWLTGFDTLIPAKNNEWHKHSSPLSYFRRLTKDADILAPELARPSQTIPETADIYAIGVLLASILRRFTTSDSRHRLLNAEEWLDWRSALLLHCLADDPGMRFQSMNHLLKFVDSIENGDLDCIWTGPHSEIEVPADDASDASRANICFSEYQVTNFQYQQFLRARQFSGAPHRTPYRGQQFAGTSQQLVRGQDRRLCGALLPVVGVSLRDAEAYCRWLSSETQRRWRLPTEREWQWAATLGVPQPYPWGDEAPTKYHGNFGEHYRGPTVVGAFEKGVAACGAFDMAGNVWEWTSSTMGPGAASHLLKGGANGYGAESLRVEVRKPVVVGYRACDTGFRVVCESGN